MEINTKVITVARHVRNFVVHHRRTWLPYGAILAFLTGVWFVWDGPGESTHTIRETKSEQNSSPPVFVATEKDTKKETGTLVYSTASAIRTKPLPDLFAQPIPKKMAEPMPTSAALPIPEKPNGSLGSQAISPSLTWPTVGGVMQSGAKRFVVLTSGGQTRLCAAGEWIDGYYVAYVHEWAVGLQKDDQIREFPL